MPVYSLKDTGARTHNAAPCSPLRDFTPGKPAFVTSLPHPSLQGAERGGEGAAQPPVIESGGTGCGVPDGGLVLTSQHPAVCSVSLLKMEAPAW